jgi:hypothetical protein
MLRRSKLFKVKFEKEVSLLPERSNDCIEVIVLFRKTDRLLPLKFNYFKIGRLLELSYCSYLFKESPFILVKLSNLLLDILEIGLFETSSYSKLGRELSQKEVS